MYGDVSTRLDGQRYVLRYGNATWDQLKRKFDAPTEAECIARAKLSPGGFAFLLLAGLLWYQPDLTLADVLRLGTESPLDGERSLSDAAWEAVVLAMPEAKQGPQKEPKGPPRKPRPHDLRRAALKAGMTPTEFGIVTPREAVMFIEAASFRMNHQLQLAITVAWHTEAFARTKKLEDLGAILRRMEPEPDEAMTPDEAMLALEIEKEEARAFAARHNARIAREEAERAKHAPKPAVDAS